MHEVPIDQTGLPAGDDVIEIDGLLARCVVGIEEEERRDRQDVLISLRIGTDATPAAIEDSPAGLAVNYRTVNKSVLAHVESTVFHTVALAAGREKPSASGTTMERAGAGFTEARRVWSRGPKQMFRLT